MLVAAADSTLADWLQGWGTVAGSILSAAAVLFTGLLLRHEIRIRRQDEEDALYLRGRSVTTKVFSKVAIDLNEPTNLLRVRIRNLGAEPIYDVRVSVRSSFGNWSSKSLEVPELSEAGVRSVTVSILAYSLLWRDRDQVDGGIFEGDAAADSQPSAPASLTKNDESAPTIDGEVLYHNLSFITEISFVDSRGMHWTREGDETPSPSPFGPAERQSEIERKERKSSSTARLLFHYLRLDAAKEIADWYLPYPSIALRQFLRSRLEKRFKRKLLRHLAERGEEYTESARYVLPVGASAHIRKKMDKLEQNLQERLSEESRLREREGDSD